MRKTLYCVLLAALLALTGCASKVTIVPIESLSPAQTAANFYTPAPTPTAAATEAPNVLPRLEQSGMSIGTRVNPPMGYTRIFGAEGSMTQFMRQYPVRMAGASVMLHDGTERVDATAAVVLDVTLGKKNHEGPAGSMARLLAEYLYDCEAYKDVTFTIGKNFEFTFDKWRKGYDLKAEGNALSWVSGGQDSNGKENFKQYLSTLFVYINMNALEKDLHRIEDVDADEIRVGDIFIGKTEAGKEHAIMVADICRNDETGERLMLLVQGGSPAQQLHIVDNPYNANIAPWYSCEFDTTLKTPDVTVDIEERYRCEAMVEE